MPARPTSGRERLRQAVAGVLGHPVVARPLATAFRGSVPIFLLHRVMPTPLLDGTEPELVERVLARLERAGARFVSLGEVIDAIESGDRLPPGAVAFTADDGYADQARVLVPLFEGAGCPLTIFLTTGLVDRTFVPWWDRLERAVAAAPAGPVTLPAGVVVVPDERAGRRGVLYDLIDRYKALPTPEAEAEVAAVEDATGAGRPAPGDAPYEPLTWDEARAIEDRGLVTFGPHTVTHPILARASAAQVDDEVAASWDRLRAELRRPLAVFCYPVGEQHDFGARECDTIRRQGFRAAVAVTRRQTRLAAAHRDPALRFRLDRIPVRDDPTSAVFAATPLRQLRDRAPRLSPGETGSS